MRLRSLKNALTLGNDWQEEWPTEDGTLWWFCGFLSTRQQQEGAVRLSVCAVSRIHNGFVYVADGHCMSQQEGVRGYWKRIESVPIPIQLAHFVAHAQE
jgi:hypothetical protein